MKMIWRACGLLGGLNLFGSAAMAIETKPTITLEPSEKDGCRLRGKGEARELENEHRRGE